MLYKCFDRKCIKFTRYDTLKQKSNGGFNMWGFEYNNLYAPYSNLNNIPYMVGGFEKRDQHLHHTDIFEEGDNYFIKIAIAGASAEQIKIKICGSKLSVFVDMTEEKRDKYLLKEIPLDGLKRVYDIKCVDREGIVANFDKCILTITLPKDKQEVCEDELELEIKCNA